jgi:hypothetical protein
MLSWADYTDNGMLWISRSVPTEDQVLVPETLLKKRKSQEKAREARAAELQKKKEVGQSFHMLLLEEWRLSDDNYHICD